MTGISSLFPAFPKQMSILDRVNINVARHKNDYFKNWTSQQLDDIDNITRPIEPVTPEIYSERIKKNEVSRNKKLTHCINMATSENAPNWAKDFLQELSSGAINSTTKAKDQATILWRKNSSSYDSKRAVQQTSRNLLRSCQSFGLTDMKILPVRKIFCRSEKKSPKIHCHMHKV